MKERQRALHGRRKGKPLSARRQRLMAEVLPDLRLDLDAPCDDVAGLFGVPVATTVLEIGFGGGEHMVAAAVADPAAGFIGVEPFVNGLAKAVAAIDRLGLRNVRLYDDDAALLMDWLPEASLDRIELPFPDPWPKKRHRKRRFVSPANLDRAARVLKSGGILLVATDVPDYAEWTLLACRRHAAFAWTARRPGDWRDPPPGWTQTRYEDKARAAGRTPVYLAFRRV